MKYEIKMNPEFNSFEITFDAKPSNEVREALKGLRFRWHSVKKVWYGYADENTIKEAIENPSKKPVKATKTASKPEKVNKYGVKVGDMFSMSWGYEQTNVDWFQVIALVGECSVRIREVNPPMVAETAESPMSADRTYAISNEILPPSSYSVHIKDNEKGDLKRVLKSGNTLYLNMASYANAYKVESGNHKVYESWYY